MRNSSQNVDTFQCMSTYDTAYKIGHMYLLYMCKISWIFETGNIVFVYFKNQGRNFATVYTKIRW